MRISKRNFGKYLKKIKSPTGCPAISWKMDNENGDGDFDEELLPTLIQLNNDKWHTVASCAGHNLRDIKNHKMAYLIEEPYRIVIFVHVSGKHINDFMSMIEDMKSSTSGYLVCSLGSNQDDLSNNTEEGYLPFEIEIHCYTKKKRDSDILSLKKSAKKYAL